MEHRPVGRCGLVAPRPGMGVRGPCRSRRWPGQAAAPCTGPVCLFLPDGARALHAGGRDSSCHLFECGLAGPTGLPWWHRAQQWRTGSQALSCSAWGRVASSEWLSNLRPEFTYL